MCGRPQEIQEHQLDGQPAKSLRCVHEFCGVSERIIESVCACNMMFWDDLLRWNGFLLNREDVKEVALLIATDQLERPRCHIVNVWMIGIDHFGPARNLSKMMPENSPAV